uniref:Uncharacterized protein n=1 Tax=Sphaerodactylus townsendi TaxID=933632 RepID=A0ACB8F0E2_9SAUR
MPPLRTGGGAIPCLPCGISRGDGGTRDSPYRLGEPIHTCGQVWHQRPGRRESVWLLHESEEEDEMPRDDYRQAAWLAVEAWHDEREELRWQVKRLSRDVELLQEALDLEIAQSGTMQRYSESYNAGGMVLEGGGNQDSFDQGTELPLPVQPQEALSTRTDQTE